jgi:hypothetical protein
MLNPLDGLVVWLSREPELLRPAPTGLQVMGGGLDCQIPERAVIARMTKQGEISASREWQGGGTALTAPGRCPGSN